MGARFGRAFARAASAPTRRRRALSDSAYLGLGLVAFLAGFAVQYGLYHRLLHAALRSRDAAVMRPAMKRWIRIAIVWQVLVLGACVLYLAVLTSRHGQGIAWISPAVGAVFGTALPLQFVAVAIMRSARGV